MPQSSKAGTAGVRRAARISGYWTEQQDWSLKVLNKTWEISDCDSTASESPVPGSLPWNDCQALGRDGVFYKYFLITATYTVCSASGADGSINEAAGCLLPPSSIRLHRDGDTQEAVGLRPPPFCPHTEPGCSAHLCRPGFCCWCLLLGGFNQYYIVRKGMRKAHSLAHGGRAGCKQWQEWCQPHLLCARTWAKQVAASSQALTSQSEDGESLSGEEEMREAEEKWVKGARQCRGEGTVFE